MSHYAVVAADRSGPALGIGINPCDAISNADKWGAKDIEGYIVVPITDDSYAAVLAGHHDEWKEET